MKMVKKPVFQHRFQLSKPQRGEGVGFIKAEMIMNYEETDKMKQKDVYTLDKEDDKAVQLFIKLGMPKNLAKTLLCISQFDECKCADVEQGADLRQPEVRDLKREGKGRPAHIYKTTSDLSEILKAFEEEKLKEVESVKKDLSELKNIMLSR
jgi:predicted transcriptional regulator